MLGRRVITDVETVEQLARDGHELGSHSYGHLHAWKTDSTCAVDDIDAGYDSVSQWVKPDGIFRPPHGKVSFATWNALRRRGARICWWTHDSGDTWPIAPSPQKVVDDILTAGGGVVLMHDFDRGHAREEFVLNTTESLLNAAKKEEFALLTLSQLYSENRKRSDARK